MRKFRMIMVVLCAAVLTACGGNVQNQDMTAPPAAEEQAGAVNSGETVQKPAPVGEPLSREALEEYTGYFDRMEHNGLLRFPYADGSDGEQIAPYLDLLFYDIGDTDISEEEYALLEAAGMFLEFDEFRLTRSYVTDYLMSRLDMTKETVESILTGDLFGIYLAETDAWYMCHGDCAWMAYDFERGEYFAENETVTLYYSNSFLTVVETDGDVEFYTDTPMVVTLSVEGGEWYVISNEMIS